MGKLKQQHLLAIDDDDFEPYDHNSYEEIIPCKTIDIYREVQKRQLKEQADEKFKKRLKNWWK